MTVMRNAGMANTGVRVSAVIPTKNRAEDLVVAVRSILNQSVAPYELIIIDQSSSEAGREGVKRLSEELRTGVEINHVLDPSIAGLVAARDAAVKIARGDLVMFFEDDVVVEPDYVERMVRAFEKYPEMLGATGIIINYKPGNGYVFFHRLFHRGIFHDPRLDWHGSDEKSEMRVPSAFLNGGLSAYRREVFERVHFDTKNGFHMVEDIEFSVRAAEAFGADRFFILPGARLYHHFAPAGRASLGPKYTRKTKEYILFFKKRRRTPKAMIDLTWLLIGMTLESGLASLRSKSAEPFVGAMRGLVSGVRQPLQF